MAKTINDKYKLKYAFSSSALKILDYLKDKEKDGASWTRMMKELGRSPLILSLNKLIDLGFVVKADGRRYYITDKGKELLKFVERMVDSN